MDLLPDILLTVHHILFPDMMDLLQLSAGGKPLSQFGTGGRRGENGPQFLFPETPTCHYAGGSCTPRV